MMQINICMDFSTWLNESNLNNLYQSAVDAFPKTTLRQHAIDPVRIVRLSIIPYKGMHTIYFKGLAQNEGREYSPSIYFKEVDFNKSEIKIKADDGLIYNLNKLSPKNEVFVRCNCGDFYWRFNYYNYLDHSLYGKKRAKYEGQYRINPKEMPGLCKHLIKLTHMLRDSGIMIG